MQLGTTNQRSNNCTMHNTYLGWRGEKGSARAVCKVGNRPAAAGAQVAYRNLLQGARTSRRELALGDIDQASERARVKNHT